MKHDWQPVAGMYGVYRCTLCKLGHRKLFGRWTKKQSQQIMDGECNGAAPKPLVRSMTKPVQHKGNTVDDLPSIERFTITPVVFTDLAAVCLWKCRKRWTTCSHVSFMLEELGLLVPREYGRSIKNNSEFHFELSRRCVYHPATDDMSTFSVRGKSADKFLDGRSDLFEFGRLSLTEQGENSARILSVKYQQVPWVAVSKWNQQWKTLHELMATGRATAAANAASQKLGDVAAELDLISTFVE